MATLFGQYDSHYTAATDSDTQTHKHTHAHTHSLDKGSNHTQRQYYVTHPHIVWSGRFEYPLTGWIIRKNFTGLQ